MRQVENMTHQGFGYMKPTYSCVRRGFVPEPFGEPPEDWLPSMVAEMTEELEQQMGGDIRYPVRWLGDNRTGIYYVEAWTRDDHLFEPGGIYAR